MWNGFILTYTARQPLWKMQKRWTCQACRPNLRLKAFTNIAKSLLLSSCYKMHITMRLLTKNTWGRGRVAVSWLKSQCPLLQNVLMRKKSIAVKNLFFSTRAKPPNWSPTMGYLSLLKAIPFRLHRLISKSQEETNYTSLNGWSSSGSLETNRPRKTIDSFFPCCLLYSEF